MKEKNNRKQSHNLEEIFYVSWEESELGWGQRPDGCSLHRTIENYEKFRKNYWQGMPATVPHEYSRPAGQPIKAYVRKELYLKIKRNHPGLRLFESELNSLIKNNQLKYGRERSGWMLWPEVV